jgi:hypothetical protein
MNRNMLVTALIGLILVLMGCASRSSNSQPERYSIDLLPTEYPRVTTAFPISPGNLLPPYGLRLRAEAVALTLRVSTSIENPAERFADIQGALEIISDAAAESDTVTLQDVVLEDVGALSPSRNEDVPQVDGILSSSLTLKLTTDLPAGQTSLIESVASFNAFLGSINLPETVSVRIVSLEPVIGNPESYREQLIARVYDELEAVRSEYGETVQFEISGLYAMPQLRKLNDTEYYVYIEPTIVVTGF